MKICFAPAVRFFSSLSRDQSSETKQRRRKKLSNHIKCFFRSMANRTSTVNLDDFTCSICREIFHSPVSLSCPHTYCQTCVFGLKKSTSTNENSALTSLRPDSEAHSTHLHQPNQIFVCAICRQESFGYVRFRAFDQQLRQLQSECSNCSKLFTLADLRVHYENCFPTSTSTSTTIKTSNSNLSESQARALQKAQEGENRSTFSCPFCSRTNFSVQHLRQHMKKRHRNENPAQICPICASMPWGDKTLIVSNVYQHIKSRHRFDYDTFVNFDQDEEAMMREALKASLFDQ